MWIYAFTDRVSQFADRLRCDDIHRSLQLLDSGHEPGEDLLWPSTHRDNCEQVTFVSMWWCCPAASLSTWLGHSKWIWKYFMCFDVLVSHYIAESKKITLGCGLFCMLHWSGQFVDEGQEEAHCGRCVHREWWCWSDAWACATSRQPCAAPRAGTSLWDICHCPASNWSGPCDTCPACCDICPAWSCGATCPASCGTCCDTCPACPACFAVCCDIGLGWGGACCDTCAACGACCGICPAWCGACCDTCAACGACCGICPAWSGACCDTWCLLWHLCSPWCLLQHLSSLEWCLLWHRHLCSLWCMRRAPGTPVPAAQSKAAARSPPHEDAMSDHVEEHVSEPAEKEPDPCPIRSKWESQWQPCLVHMCVTMSACQSGGPHVRAAFLCTTARWGVRGPGSRRWNMCRLSGSLWRPKMRLLWRPRSSRFLAEVICLLLWSKYHMSWGEVICAACFCGAVGCILWSSV